jgi:hypothetical protein
MQNRDPYGYKEDFDKFVKTKIIQDKVESFQNIRFNVLVITV